MLSPSSWTWSKRKVSKSSNHLGKVSCHLRPRPPQLEHGHEDELIPAPSVSISRAQQLFNLPGDEGSLCSLPHHQDSAALAEKFVFVEHRQ